MRVRCLKISLLLHWFLFAVWSCAHAGCTLWWPKAQCDHQQPYVGPSTNVLSMVSISMSLGILCYKMLKIVMYIAEGMVFVVQLDLVILQLNNVCMGDSQMYQCLNLGP